MVKSSVKVIVRTRPTDQFAHNCLNWGNDQKSITANLPRRKRKDDFVNNQQDTWSFKFDAVLHNASQELVYETAVRDVVTSVLQGYNGTVLAYGQTGAGKTFTMCGGNDFKQRGVIPRAVTAVFNEIGNRPESSFEIWVSYIEIYNEHLYDALLDADSSAVDLAIQEDGKGGVVVKGLSQKKCDNESDALSYFFEGSANRSIAEHKLNTNSTRSHCIFTIHVNSRSRVESDGHAVYSKLHCVDLAGSERLSKTGSEGVTQKEAMYINKSLTFLEQVVIALSTAGREHVPYRQTKLTNLLKDSLGGNCKTTMIANIWAEEEHIDETISTLRFASRMMRVQNDATVNVVSDPEVQLRRLQREVLELKAELQMQNQLNAKSHITYGEEFTDDERFRLQQQVRNYLDGTTANLEFKSVREVNEMFRIFRQFVEQAETESSTKRPLTNKEQSKAGATIKVENGSGTGVGDVDGNAGFGVGTAVPAKGDRAAHAQAPSQSNGNGDKGSPANLGPETNKDSRITTVELPDRGKAYEEFKIVEGAELAAALKETQQALVEKKRLHKVASTQVNDSKAKIDRLQIALDNKRNTRNDQPDDTDVFDEDEFRMLQELKEFKQSYRTAYADMQRVKNEKEYESRLVEQCRSKLLLAFERWYEETYGVTLSPSSPMQSMPSFTNQRSKRRGTEDMDETLDAEDPESAAYYAARKAATISTKSAKKTATLKRK